MAACNNILGFNLATGEKVLVDDVKIITVNSNLVKYFAVVSGLLPDGCSRIGKDVQEVDLNMIEVTLNSTRFEDGSCSFPDTTPFKKKVPLDVRGVPVGVYYVEVNGVIAPGSLTKDHQ